LNDKLVNIDYINYKTHTEKYLFNKLELKILVQNDIFNPTIKCRGRVPHCHTLCPDYVYDGIV